MSTYRLVATPILRYRFAAKPPELTTKSVALAVIGASVRSVARQGWAFEVQVDLDRSDHAAALDALATALVGLGFEFTNAYIAEWADNAAQGLVVGLVGGAGGGALTNKPEVALLTAGLGALAGHWAGSQMRRIERAYLASRDRYGRGWVLTQLPQEQRATVLAAAI